MADITKCKGTDCPVKHSCYRFTAESSERQSWFVFSPYDKDADDCYKFWHNNKPLTQLKRNNEKRT